MADKSWPNAERDASFGSLITSGLGSERTGGEVELEVWPQRGRPAYTGPTGELWRAILAPSNSRRKKNRGQVAPLRIIRNSLTFRPDCGYAASATSALT